MPAHVAGDAGAIAWANGVDAGLADKLDAAAADVVVAALVGNPASDTATILKSTYAPTLEWPIPNTPVQQAPGTTVLSSFAEFVVDPNGTTLHQFAMVTGTTSGIWHASSTDQGVTWAWDGAPILTPGSETWENLTVGVPTVWCESGTWYMLYRGTGNGTFVIGTGLASATAATGPWTRVQAGPSYVIGGVGNTDEPGPGRLIKVGSTYYLFGSTVASTYQRDVHVWSSTDRVTWTKDPAGSLWGQTGRFCNCVWQEGDFYYSLVPHYRGDGHGAIGTNVADLELWRSTVPQFYAANRQLLGTFVKAGASGTWSEKCLDTPTVLVTDITKTSYPTMTGGKPWIFYAGEDVNGKWLSGLIKLPALPNVLKLSDTIPVVSTVGSPSVLGAWQWNAIATTKSFGFIGRVGDPLSAGVATLKFATMQQAGSIIGIVLMSSDARTGGTITASILDTAGTVITGSPGAALSTGSTQMTSTQIAAGVCHVAAGTRIGVGLSSSVWTPAGSNVLVELLVAYDV